MLFGHRSQIGVLSRTHALLRRAHGSLRVHEIESAIGRRRGESRSSRAALRLARSLGCRQAAGGSVGVLLTGASLGVAWVVDWVAGAVVGAVVFAAPPVR